MEKQIRSSNVQKRWQQIDAVIQHYDATTLREFMTASAKFLIPQRFWDALPPITDFDSDSNIQSFHRGFQSLTGTEMQSAPQDKIDLVRLLKVAAQPSRRPSKRIGKKKLTALRRRMEERFRQYILGQARPARGAKYYISVMKQNFMK